jgi:hypothetical protein
MAGKVFVALLGLLLMSTLAAEAIGFSLLFFFLFSF